MVAKRRNSGFREIFLSSPPYHLVFVGENTKEGFPNLFLHTFWSNFTTHRKYSGCILAVRTTWSIQYFLKSNIHKVVCEN